MKQRACELCCANATVFCPSDDAFLCRTCDSKVHDANFLVARHVRQPLVKEEEVVSDDESSSACISSTTKETTKKSQRKMVYGTNTYEAEGILVNWCGKIGVGDDVVIRTACGALRVCLDKWKCLPFRVGLAASMWLGLRVGGVVELSVLKRLEDISGVPSKVILAAESKVGRAIRASRVERRSRVELQEGWAEC